jgi:hypothetical protein
MLASLREQVNGVRTGFLEGCGCEVAGIVC